MKTNEEQVNNYEVVGAGTIRIGKVAFAKCGMRTGFTFGVSWGSYGYTGGVLPRSEAKKLAEDILAELEKHTETEEEAYNYTEEEQKRALDIYKTKI